MFFFLCLCLLSFCIFIFCLNFPAFQVPTLRYFSSRVLILFYVRLLANQFSFVACLNFSRTLKVHVILHSLFPVVGFHFTLNSSKSRSVSSGYCMCSVFSLIIVLYLSLDQVSRPEISMLSLVYENGVKEGNFFLFPSFIFPPHVLLFLFFFFVPKSHLSLLFCLLFSFLASTLPPSHPSPSPAASSPHQHATISIPNAVLHTPQPDKKDLTGGEAFGVVAEASLICHR